MIDSTTHKPHSSKQQLYFLFVAFAVGMAVIAIEKTITRLLIPYIGSTLYTDVGLTTALTLCLAMGYYIGGNKAKKEATTTSLYKFLAGIGAYVSLLSCWAWTGARILSTGTTIHPWRIFLTSWASTFLLIGLPLVLVGVIITHLIELSTTQQPVQVGRTIGKIIAWVAIGGITGGALATFLALPFLGTQQTIFYIGCFLLIVAFISLVNVKLQSHHTTSK